MNMPFVSNSSFYILTFILLQVRISVSSICYMRHLFPDDCFQTVDYGNSKIHQLQSAEYDEQGNLSVRNGDAFLLTQWLEKGVFAALTNEYLNTLTFSVFMKHPKTGKDLLLENYEFKITYHNKSSPTTLNGVPLVSKEGIKTQASKFIRSLVEFTNTLDDLPAERWITLSLTVNMMQ